MSNEHDSFTCKQANCGECSRESKIEGIRTSQLTPVSSEPSGGESREHLLRTLVMAKTQLAVGRRFLPSHGSFGEEGIDSYQQAQDAVAFEIDRLQQKDGGTKK